MKPIRALLPLFVVLLIVLAAHTALAGCYQLQEAQEICSGAGGCEGNYTAVFCVSGCIAGECFEQAGSGECCGRIYYLASLYPDGGICHGDCDNARVRVHARSSHVSSQHSAELRRGYSPGLIMLTADLSYKEPQLVYTFDRCNHNYGLLAEDGKVLALGGM
jgi:hypothetical protein